MPPNPWKYQRWSHEATEEAESNADAEAEAGEAEAGEPVTNVSSLSSSWSTEEGRRLRRKKLSTTASESWKLSRKELCIKKELSRTLKSTIYLATWKGTEVVVKSVKSAQNLHSDLAHEESEMMPNDKIAEELLMEIEHLASFRHPDLVMFLGACLDSTLPMCVTEYMPMGDMERYYQLNRQKYDSACWRPKLSQVVGWALATCRALSFLHGREIPMVHRDLKPLNLLLTKYLEVKVADLGIARVLARAGPESGDCGQKGMTGGIGTWRYMAPEVVRHQKYTEKVDIYALGLIMYFMSSGKQPFHQLGINPEKILQAYLKGNEPRPLLTDCHQVLRPTMAQAWHESAQARPSADELLSELSELGNLDGSSGAKCVYIGVSRFNSPSAVQLFSS